MKKVIIVVIVLALIGAVAYFYIIPKVYKPSSSGLSSTFAIPPESPPPPGSNTQDFLQKATNLFPSSNQILALGKTASQIFKTMDYNAAQNLYPQLSQCEPAFTELQNGK